MNTMWTLKRLSAGLLAVLGIACLPASAQLVSGNLSGTVYDVSGATDAMSVGFIGASLSAIRPRGPIKRAITRS